jgi:hypothetical protein
MGPGSMTVRAMVDPSMPREDNSELKDELGGSRNADEFVCCPEGQNCLPTGQHNMPISRYF